MSYQAVLYPQPPSPYLLNLGAEGMTIGGPNSPAPGAWPAANRAIYLPVRLPVNAYVASMQFWCTTTNSANFDIGLYDFVGTRLGSSGSTALSASAINIWTPANPILLQAGRTYYAALVCVSISSTIGRAQTSVLGLRAAGLAQQATALPLPATATFAQVASAYVPLISLTFRGVPT